MGLIKGEPEFLTDCAGLDWQCSANVCPQSERVPRRGAPADLWVAEHV